MTTFKQMSNLRGRRALITGAGGNLGKVFSETLAELGADLILVDLPNSNAEMLQVDLEKRYGIKVEYIPCNLEIAHERSNLINSINTTSRGLNILINNAAFVGTSNLSGWNVPFADQSLETWRRVFEVNLTSIFDLCKGFYPALKASDNASIINIASIYGIYAPNWSLYEGTNMSNAASYAASKGGLIQLTRWLATTLAPEIRVNAISPGGIFRNQPEVFVRRYSDKTPLGRMAKEEDFRGALAYLASDLSLYMTGQILQVDGGWGIW